MKRWIEKMLREKPNNWRNSLQYLHKCSIIDGLVSFSRKGPSLSVSP